MPAESTSAATSSGPVVTLERTPCFGGCPVYTVAVSRSGKVTYQGRAHVRRLGTATAQIPQPRVDSLLHELDRGGYFTYADRYVQSEPACGRYATDSPSAITTVSHRGRTKRIEHDYGCGSAPGALVVLERRIDEMLGSARWTGR
ncbi:MAG: DUF6438 domain-containing protein [Gemmatimonadales bacterium]